jgi:hypothetical protein
MPISVIIGICIAVAVIAQQSLLARERERAAGINVQAFLKALRAVESDDNPRALGTNGERGPYQFTEGTWEETTRMPFIYAFSRTASDQVARDRVFMLLRLAHRVGILPGDRYEINGATEPEILAAMWHFGEKRGIWLATNVKASRYCQRVNALYLAYKAEAERAD